MTPLDIVTDAFSEIGTYAPSEVLSGADSSYAFGKLNDLLDSWTNDSLITFAIQEQAAPLIPGTFQYTVGPGGMFNMPRPLRVLYGAARAYVMDQNGNRYPIEVVQRDQWNLIGNLINQSSSLPMTMFYDPQFPLGVINLWPIPTLPYTLFWDSFLPLVDFISLGSTVTLPPGYARALKLNEAVELWGAYKPDNVVLSPSLKFRADEALAAVKRTNIRPYRALYDRAILRWPRDSYNIYRGF